MNTTLESETSLCTSFDEKEFSSALDILDSASKARFITFSEAQDLRAVLDSSTAIFKSSISTPHFQETLGLLERLSRTPVSKYNTDFTYALPKFTKVVISELNTKVQEQPDTYLLPAFNLSESLTKIKQRDYLDISLDLVRTNLDLFLENTEIENRSIEEAVRLLISLGEIDDVVKIALDSISSNSALYKRFPRVVDSFLNLTLLGPNTYNRSARLEAIMDKLTGGAGKDIMDVWDDSMGKERNRSNGAHSAHLENFGAVCQLERARPGIVDFLYYQYNINNFARYPIEMLIEQYDTRAEQDVDYGLVISANHDINSYAYKRRGVFKNIYEQSQAIGYRVKIFEAANATDVMQSIVNSFYYHGLISYAFIFAHGDTDELTIGVNGFDGKLMNWQKSHFVHTTPESFESIRSKFTPEAFLGFISCWAGHLDGFAQEFSSKLRNIDIHAADHSVYLKDNGVQLSKEDGKLQVKLLFGYDTMNGYTAEDVRFALSDPETSELKRVDTGRTLQYNNYDVVTRVYRSGQLIGDYIK